MRINNVNSIQPYQVNSDHALKVKPRLQRGFTLIEILMVVVIVGIMAGVIIVSSNLSNLTDNDLELEAHRLKATLTKITEDSVIMNVQYGLKVYSNGYDVLRHGQIETASGLQPAWLALDHEWAKKRLPNDYILSLALDGAGYVTPEKAIQVEQEESQNQDNATTSNKRAENALRKPEVLILSSGETTNVRFRIVHSTDKNDSTAVANTDVDSQMVVQMDSIGQVSILQDDAE